MVCLARSSSIAERILSNNFWRFSACCISIKSITIIPPCLAIVTDEPPSSAAAKFTSEHLTPDRRPISHDSRYSHLSREKLPCVLL